MKRGSFIASSLSAALAGCGAIGTKLNDNKAAHSILTSAEDLNLRVIGTAGGFSIRKKPRASSLSRNQHSQQGASDLSCVRNPLAAKL